MSKVKSNLELIHNLLSRSEDKYGIGARLITPLKVTIYGKIESFVHQSRRILEEELQNMNEDVRLCFYLSHVLVHSGRCFPSPRVCKTQAHG